MAALGQTGAAAARARVHAVCAARSATRCRFWWQLGPRLLQLDLAGARNLTLCAPAGWRGAARGTPSSLMADGRFRCTHPGCGKVFTQVNTLCCAREKIKLRSGGNRWFHGSPARPPAHAQDRNRRRHERLHDGRKPHKCPDCGKAFARNSDLKVHRVCHSGLRTNEKEKKITGMQAVLGLRLFFVVVFVFFVFIIIAAVVNVVNLSACLLPEFVRVFLLSSWPPLSCGCVAWPLDAGSPAVTADERPYECAVPGCGKRFARLVSMAGRAACISDS